MGRLKRENNIEEESLAVVSVVFVIIVVFQSMKKNGYDHSTFSVNILCQEPYHGTVRQRIIVPQCGFSLRKSTAAIMATGMIHVL